MCSCTKGALMIQTQLHETCRQQLKCLCIQQDGGDERSA